MPGIISNKGFLGLADHAIKQRVGAARVADLTASEWAKDRIGLILNSGNYCADL